MKGLIPLTKSCDHSNGFKSQHGILKTFTSQCVALSALCSVDAPTLLFVPRYRGCSDSLFLLFVQPPGHGPGDLNASWPMIVPLTQAGWSADSGAFGSGRLLNTLAYPWAHTTLSSRVAVHN